MRHKSIVLLLSLTFFIAFFAHGINAKAMHTGFDTEEMSEEDKTIFLKNVSITLFKTAPEKRGIQQFDVNEQGMIAVCQEHFGKKEVCIYNAQGEFLYGYSFNTSGSFRVEWDRENINILFVRGGTLVSVDPDGTIVDMKDVPSTSRNSSYSLDLESTRRTVGETQYRIRNHMGILNLLASSYSQIVVTDPTGTERMIYDVNADQLIRTIVVLILIISLITITVVGLVREFKKAQREKEKSAGEKLWSGVGKRDW